MLWAVDALYDPDPTGRVTTTGSIASNWKKLTVEIPI